MFVGRYFLVLCALLLGIGVTAIIYPDIAVALTVTAVLSTLSLFIFRHYCDDQLTITKVFLIALFCRLIFGSLVQVFDLREFFGGDSITYDFLGNRLMEYWSGHSFPNDFQTRKALSVSGAGWGMHHFVAAIYFVLGRNVLAAQSVCAVIGASTAPMVYLCAQKVFENRRVAVLSAYAIALFPSFIIWSSQLMKDGLIIFLLVLCMTMILELQEKFSYLAAIILVLSLFGVMSLRFYIFYMVLVAVAGSFLIGTSSSFKSILRRSLSLLVIGLGLTYFGVIRTASTDLGRYGNLEAVQRSRLDLATSASSGFGADLDVSTADGAIVTVPIGLTYLMLAPFPWQMANIRQSLTLPEVLVWWSLIPLVISGFWYSIRYRWRKSLPILIFTITLAVAYSIFQGNVGTAYRQRTQIQVFLMIFAAVGWTIYQEKRSDMKMLARPRQNLSRQDI